MVNSHILPTSYLHSSSASQFLQLKNLTVWQKRMENLVAGDDIDCAVAIMFLGNCVKIVKLKLCPELLKACALVRILFFFSRM